MNDRITDHITPPTWAE